MIKNNEEYPTSHPKEFDRLERKAARLGWHIPEDKKAAIVDRQIEIATSAEETARDAAAAAKTLVAMNSQNVTLAVSRVEEPTEKAAPVPLETLLAMRSKTIGTD